MFSLEIFHLAVNVRNILGGDEVTRYHIGKWHSFNKREANDQSEVLFGIFSLVILLLVGGFHEISSLIRLLNVASKRPEWVTRRT
jgi:hypothetical protein